MMPLLFKFLAGAALMTLGGLWGAWLYRADWRSAWNVLRGFLCYAGMSGCIAVLLPHWPWFLPQLLAAPVLLFCGFVVLATVLRPNARPWLTGHNSRTEKNHHAL